jgi:hypothetical protein
MPVSEVPIKRTSITKTFEALNTIFDPLTARLLTMLEHFEQTIARHHLHDVVRLLYSPEVVWDAIHRSRNRMTIPNLEAFGRKEVVDRVTWHFCRPEPPLLYQRTAKVPTMVVP